MEQSKLANTSRIALGALSIVLAIVAGFIGASLSRDLLDAAVYAVGAFIILYILIIFVVYATALAIITVIRKAEDEH